MIDRYGEQIEDDAEVQDSHDRCCRRGWLGEDADGHPIPCLICRPHLRRQEP